MYMLLFILLFLLHYKYFVATTYPPIINSAINIVLNIGVKNVNSAPNRNPANTKHASANNIVCEDGSFISFII